MFEARLAEPAANARVLASLVHTLGMMRRRAEALERFGQLQQAATAEHVPALNLAIAHLGLAQQDEALDYLQRACTERSAALYQLAVDPIYRSLRESRRFRAILREMRLEARDVVS